MRGLSPDSVDMVLTDVPYAVGFKHSNTTYNDDTDFIKGQLPLWYSEWFRLLKDNAFLMLFTGVKNLEHWIYGGKQAGFTFKNILATRIFHSASNRAKNNFGFNLQTVLVFAKGEGRRLNEVDAFPTSPEWLKDSRNKSRSPYTYEYPNFIEPQVFVSTEKFGSDSKGTAFHPNAKNVDFCRFLVEVATDKGDLVLDPFAGSGAIGVAALSVGRRFLGMEIDEFWQKTASKRISGDCTWRRGERGATQGDALEQMDLFN